MPQNTVELLIQARDDASRSFNQAITEAERSLGRVGQRTDELDRSGQRLDVGLSRVTRTARIFGVVLLSDLSPGLGQLVMNMRLATEGARFLGGGIAGVAGAITGIALAAFAAYISHVVDASKRQAEMNLAVASFDPSPMRGRLKDLALDLGRGADEWKRFNESSIFSASIFQSLAAGVQITIRSLAELFGRRPAEEIEEINRSLGKASAPEHALNLLKMRQEWTGLETAITVARVKAKGFVDEQDRVDRALIKGIQTEKDAAIAIINETERVAVSRAGAIRDVSALKAATEDAAAGRIQAEQKAELEITKITAAAAERKRLFLETGTSEELALIRKREAAKLSVLEESLEGERALLKRRLELTAKFSKDEGEQATAGIRTGFMALEDEVGTFGQRASTATRGIGHAMFDALDDSFFSVATGKFNDLGNIAKRAGADMLRSFIGVLTGPLKQQLIQSFAGLFGIRAGPGFSPASLAAVVPGGAGVVPGVGPQTAGQVAGQFFGVPVSAAGTAVPTAEVLRDAAAAQAAGLSAAASFAGGAIGLVGAAMSQNPFMGAVSGGLGGASFAAAAGFAAGGIVAGGLIGIVAGAAIGSQNRRAAGRTARQMGMFNRLLELVDENAPFLSPAQFDQIIGFFNISRRHAWFDPTGLTTGQALGGEMPTDPAVLDLFRQAGFTAQLSDPAFPAGAAVVFGADRMAQIVSDLRELRVVTMRRGLDLEYEGPLLTRQAFAEGITRLEAAPGPGPPTLTTEQLIDLWRQMPSEAVQAVLDRMREVQDLTDSP